jgi:transcriptional regulator with XRE-family HTH domain
MFKEWKHFGEFIKCQRNKVGVSAREIVNRLNVAESQYIKIESGVQKVHVDMLPAIASQLKIKYDQLYRIHFFYDMLSKAKEDVMVIPMLNSIIERIAEETGDYKNMQSGSC